MSKYFNPASKVPTVGRLLSRRTNEIDLSTLQQMLHPGEVVVGYFEKLSYPVAPLLSTQETIDEYHKRYHEGWFISVAYYAIPEEVAAECIR